MRFWLHCLKKVLILGDSQNIYFDRSSLKYVGNNVIIGRTVRFRAPHKVVLHDNSIIDDHCYISGELELGPYSHIGPNVSIIGGGVTKIGVMSGISAGSVLITGTSNFLVPTLDLPTIPDEFRCKSQASFVTLDDFVYIGANSTILPGVDLPKGFACTVGSILRRRIYSSWALYSGQSGEKICNRSPASLVANKELLVRLLGRNIDLKG